MTFLQTIVDDYVTPLFEGGQSGLLRPGRGGAPDGRRLRCGAWWRRCSRASSWRGWRRASRRRSATTCSNHMQRLPIKYYDTHTFGDVMSYYTNDVDTLRQMLSQSIPQDGFEPGDHSGRVRGHGGDQPHPHALCTPLPGFDAPGCEEDRRQPPPGSSSPQQKNPWATSTATLRR